MNNYPMMTTDKLVSLLTDEEGGAPIDDTALAEELIGRCPETAADWQDLKIFSRAAPDPAAYLLERVDYYLQKALYKLGYDIDWEELYYDPDDEEEEYTRRYWAVSFSHGSFRPTIHIYQTREAAEKDMAELRKLGYDVKLLYLCGTSDDPAGEDCEREWEVAEVRDEP